MSQIILTSTSDIFKERYLGGWLEIAYKDDQVPFILLTDSQYILFQNGSMQIVETV